MKTKRNTRDPGQEHLHDLQAGGPGRAPGQGPFGFHWFSLVFRVCGSLPVVLLTVA